MPINLDMTDPKIVAACIAIGVLLVGMIVQPVFLAGTFLKSDAPTPAQVDPREEALLQGGGRRRGEEVAQDAQGEGPGGRGGHCLPHAKVRAHLQDPGEEVMRAFDRGGRHTRLLARGRIASAATLASGAVAHTTKKHTHNP